MPAIIFSVSIVSRNYHPVKLLWTTCFHEARAGRLHGITLFVVVQHVIERKEGAPLQKLR